MKTRKKLLPKTQKKLLPKTRKKLLSKTRKKLLLKTLTTFHLQSLICYRCLHSLIYYFTSLNSFQSYLFFFLYLSPTFFFLFFLLFCFNCHLGQNQSDGRELEVQQRRHAEEVRALKEKLGW